MTRTAQLLTLLDCNMPVDRIAETIELIRQTAMIEALILNIKAEERIATNETIFKSV